MRWGLVFGLLMTGALVGAQEPGSAPVVAPSSTAAPAMADQLQSALAGLKTAVSGLDPDTLHLKPEQKQALSDSQASLERNLDEAVPGLLAGFRAAPSDVGAAFRLYRDAEAVLGVAQRSAESLSPRDADNGVSALQASTDQLRSRLDQLGDWIETEASANYASLQSLRAAANAAAKPAPAAVAPKTLVIDDANGVAKPAKKTAAKIPH